MTSAAPTGNVGGTMVVAAAATTTSVALTWTASGGATGYKIFRSSVYPASFTQVGTSGTASFTDSTGNFRFLNLSPGAYNLSAELAGMGTAVRSNLRVSVGQSGRLLLIHELKGMPARKAPHLFKPLDRHQGGQRLALPLDDEFVAPEGDPIQHVANSLPNVHRRDLVGHLSNSSKYYSCYRCYMTTGSAVLSA